MSQSDTPSVPDLLSRLVQFQPFSILGEQDKEGLHPHLSEETVQPGAMICEQGFGVSAFFVIETGSAEVKNGEAVVSHRGPGDVVGERALMRDGRATLSVIAEQDCRLLRIESHAFIDLMSRLPEFAQWFQSANEGKREEGSGNTGLMAVQVSEMMARRPITCSQNETVRAVAQIMRDNVISSVMITEGEALLGIVTVHDMTNKVLAEGLTGDIPVSMVMTPKPLTIGVDDLGLDALITMSERKINHLPVMDRLGRLVGMIGRTDLFRQQAATASHMVAQLVEAQSASEMADITARLPQLLGNLVSSGLKPHAICRRITDITDAVTRRLLRLAEDTLGPPPVSYVWAACGSQGRREQTGVSDQDNCLIIDDAMTDADEAYFEKLAHFVCDGLNEAGFVYCPGDMMATNPRWRQPISVWRDYFQKWIAQPDNEAQMLASVMFDLRPIVGQSDLFYALQTETLENARRNSIFTRHMIGNSLKHTPPLSLFGGLSLIGSGEHKNSLDLKHAGVVPIVDLGRVYALSGGLTAVNTRERVMAAGDAGIISASGMMDLVDALDLIAQTRLNHQAGLIAEGEAADNYLKPSHMSDLERKHLRDAFTVVKTMQSAVNSWGG